MATFETTRPFILVTGSSGLIGRRLIDDLRETYQVVGLDLQPPADPSLKPDWIRCDMTDDKSVESALQQVRRNYGDQIVSTIHLAAYYDFSGEPSPLYRTLTVDGTRRLLHGLQEFQVEQFIFSSTLLVMKPTDDDRPLDAASPVEAEWDYPQSKLAAEKVIREERDAIPAVVLRMAGVYDEDCHSLPIAQQISRIYEKQLESYVFPGDKTCGQAFIHLDDLVSCIRQSIERRDQLAPHEVFVVGEEEVMSYEALQDELGELIHGKEWPTIRIPKAAAKAGAWVQEKMAGDSSKEPFIKPWMIDLADQNYPVDIQHVREKLDWKPKHTLRETLPVMVERLQEDPQHWYQINKLPLPDNIKELETAGAKSA